jgi:hypothetical protein
MLDWLGKKLGIRKESTNPLASAEALREIIEELPQANGVRALQDIGEWLALTSRPDLAPTDRVTAIRTLDAEAARFMREVMFEYLSSAPTHHRAEHTWFTVSTYDSQIFGACRGALRDLFDTNGPLERDKTDAALFAARALAALASRKKLLRMRFRVVDASLWGDIYGTYQLADQLGPDLRIDFLFCRGHHPAGSDAGRRAELEPDRLAAFEAGPVAEHTRHDEVLGLGLDRHRPPQVARALGLLAGLAAAASDSDRRRILSQHAGVWL